MPRPQPEQQAPPVQRLRVRYAKRGRLRFTSHRDVSRALERAIFRAGIPMAYTSGFNPHPRISYAGASPTGAASEAEYLELGLSETTAPDTVATELDASLPPGLDIVEVVEASGGALADQLQASEWWITLPGLDSAVVVAAVDAFLAADVVEVERMTKKGLRRFDVRSAVVRLAADADGDVNGLCAVLRHGTPMVRPDDLLTGIGQVADLQSPPGAVLQRRSQGLLREDGSIGDPLRP